MKKSYKSAAAAMLLLLSFILTTACSPSAKVTSVKLETEKETELETTLAAGDQTTADANAEKTGSAGKDQTDADAAEKTEKLPEGYRRSQTAGDYVAILMDSGASIVMKLRADVAPITVANFQKLVGKGFYNGLIFHRIIPDFMIQGGDPDGNGRGGSDEEIKGEFAQNGVDNPLSHKRGVVSMARSQLPDSASSQFFICQGDSLFLDGAYAAFGEVLQGMEEVDRIVSLKRDANDYPETPPVMEEVFFVTPEGN